MKKNLELSIYGSIGEMLVKTLGLNVQWRVAHARSGKDLAKVFTYPIRVNLLKLNEEVSRGRGI